MQNINPILFPTMTFGVRKTRTGPCKAKSIITSDIDEIPRGQAFSMLFVPSVRPAQLYLTGKLAEEVTSLNVRYSHALSACKGKMLPDSHPVIKAREEITRHVLKIYAQLQEMSPKPCRW